jgi:hypothetical protein
MGVRRRILGRDERWGVLLGFRQYRHDVVLDQIKASGRLCAVLQPACVYFPL